MNTELDVFIDVLKGLEFIKAEYMVTGSIAKVYYSTPRMTRDMDIVINLLESQVSNLVSLFSENYYLEKSMIEDAIRRKGTFNIIHNTKLVKIDFIIPKESVFERNKIERRNRINLGNNPIWIISKEDLILSKLEWARESLSDLQLRDVADLLSLKDLDLSYLEAWIKTLHLQKPYEIAKKI